MANQFETKILDAAKAAQNFYNEMTGEYYIRHAHESFLQNFIVFKMADEYCIYIDCSPEKIKQDTTAGGRGKTPMKNKRFDLVFWKKSEDKVKAVVEIKRACYPSLVVKDIEKVATFGKRKHPMANSGYVLYYSDCQIQEHRGGQDEKLIEKRFKSVKDQSESKIVVSCIEKAEDEDPWGFALYKVF